jgi:hypothetical protein
MLELLLFVGGVVVGVVLAKLPRRRVKFEFRADPTPPSVTAVRCQPGGRTVEIDVTAGSSTGGLELVALYTRVDDNDPGADPSPTGATRHDPATSATLTHTLPGRLMGPKDYVVFWAEYRTFVSFTFEYDSCTGTGTGTGNGTGAVTDTGTGTGSGTDTGTGTGIR